MTPSLQRRSFLKSITVSSGALFFPYVRSQAAKKLQFGGIGVGGKGASDIANTAAGAEIVALCDVDRQRLEKSKTLYPNARVFEDFREMFAAMGDKLDGVTISTPDHSHFPAAMEAIRRGKHICVQKPLVNRVWEANQLHQAAKAKGVITNMGNQGHLIEGIRLLKEYLTMGIIGRVKEIHVWTNRPIWPQGQKAKDALVPEAIPANLNWQAWLAQCPEVLYTPKLHPFAWRGHREYGSGAIGDMGCHTMDGPFFSCDLGDPYRIEAEVDDATDITFPSAAAISMFHKTKAFGEIKVIWYDGKRKPQRPAELDADVDWDKMTSGALYIGEEGKLLTTGDHANNPRLLPFSKHEDWLKKANHKPSIERAKAKDPQIELVQAILSGGVCGSNFDYSVPLTRHGALGNIGVLLPRTTLEWDTKAQQFTNSAEANKLLKRAAIRAGWEAFA